MTYLDLLKSVEFWTGMNTGDISGDASLKSDITARLNIRLDRYSGRLGASSSMSQTDDTNYTNHPFSLFDIVEDQHDYEFLLDEDGNAITDITAVLIKVGSSFRKINKVTLDNSNAELIMSPNSKPGIPTQYLERNNTIFLDPVPNYNLSEGGKLFYKRSPSYFVVGDTTKKPGIIPADLHDIVAVGTSYDWLIVKKPNAKTQITIVRDELDRMEKEFQTYQQLRNPQRNMITPRRESTR